MSATIAAPPPLKEVVCPICLARGKRRILARASAGSIIEAFCRECRYRKVVLV